MAVIKKMRQILFLFIIILISSCFQEKSEPVEFKTVVYDLYNPKDSSEFENWKMEYLKQQCKIINDTLFAQDSLPVGALYYMDKDYKVYGYCNGEFGGALMFQDRNNSDSIYYLECTCPVMIDKRPDGFYITSSLAHMGGFGKVQFFASPKDLIMVHLDSLRTNWKKRRFSGLNEREIWKKLENQGEVLIDTIGLTFNILFPFKDKNYLIFSDNKNTCLGYLTSGHLVTIDTLLNLPTWRYSDLPNDIINNFYHYNFERVSGYNNGKIYKETKSSGDIYVRNDTIVIAYKYKIETKPE